MIRNKEVLLNSVTQKILVYFYRNCRQRCRLELKEMWWNFATECTYATGTASFAIEWEEFTK